MHEFGAGGSGVPYLGPEVSTRDRAAAAKIRAFRIDASHPPAFAWIVAGGVLRDAIHGIGMIAVHMGDD
jgi:hypothetical protein